MSEETKQLLFECWNQGKSLSETVSSIKFRTNVILSIGEVQQAFAKLSNRYH